ncbi:hypothetical protein YASMINEVIRUS_508 [Yasminevirus sp. GU-2018]|uniref:Uncharacterized protein n=1 Tax=Yasminevirus sp. GU-2018 TaxID=2420051 RepID=A0A5K0U8A3_9VIRU|nr:hypothetical protein YASMINEVIRUS_508 [Yasminevirus sp. GU-2018]
MYDPSKDTTVDHVDKLQKYSGSFMTSGFSMANLVCIIATVLKFIGLFEWTSCWNRKYYFLNIALKIFFFKAVFEAPVHIVYNKELTKRKFEEPLTGTISFKLFDFTIFSFTAYRMIFFPIYLLLTTQLSGTIQSIVPENNKKWVNYFNSDHNLMLEDINDSALSKLNAYEYYVPHDAKKKH